MTSPYGNKETAERLAKARQEAEKVMRRNGAGSLMGMIAEAFKQEEPKTTLVTIVRPETDWQETAALAVGGLIAKLVTVRMVQKMFGLPFKRAFGYVTLAHLLTINSDYFSWTKRSK